ncbi:MAG: hypothetical protein ABIG64_06355 [Candidatus Omnitrophota bacterium]
MKIIIEPNFTLFIGVLLFLCLVFFTTSAYADFSDFLRFANSYGKTVKDTGFDASFDYDINGKIDATDLAAYTSSNLNRETSDDEDDKKSNSDEEEQVPGDFDGDRQITTRDINIKNYMLQMINFQSFTNQLFSNFSLQNNYYPLTNITAMNPVSQTIPTKNYLDLGQTITATIANIGNNTGLSVDQEIPYDKIYMNIIELTSLNMLEAAPIYNNLGKLTSIELSDKAGVLKQAITFDQTGTVSGRQLFYYDINGTLSRVDSYSKNGIKTACTFFDDQGKTVKTENYDNTGAVVAITYNDAILTPQTKNNFTPNLTPEKNALELKTIKQEQSILFNVLPIAISEDTKTQSHDLNTENNKIIDDEKYQH